MCKDYDVKYTNKQGELVDCVVTANDVRHAINTALELHPDAERIMRVVRQPMF